MGYKKTLLISSGFIAFLLIGTVIYSLMGDNDSYKYFTGLGSSISISPDDTKFVFSYYRNGNEAIYTANIDGTNVEKITNPEKVRHRDPQYSSDGGKLLYLVEDAEGSQSLYVSNFDGSDPKRISKKGRHVSEAIFSTLDDTVYYVGMPAEDFKKEEGKRATGKQSTLFPLLMAQKKKQLYRKRYLEICLYTRQVVWYWIRRAGSRYIRLYPYCIRICFCIKKNFKVKRVKREAGAWRQGN